MKNKPLKKTDYASNQEVRWCPGCGDYAILASMQKTFADLGVKKENTVFVSGIGCSGRFPYYMNTYGFHTIHGRAPAVATGLKITRPELNVWVITGDGDGLSIGGNHLMHALRRNIDIKIVLFNNRIYGLTKGQYSPTSEQGKITNTTPLGSADKPLNPLAVALASEATFVARALDIDAKGLQSVLKAAAAHKGSAFVEILQNCNIYNDGAFNNFAERSIRQQRTVWLEQGKPLLFGVNNEKAIRLNQLQLEVVAASEKDLLIHDATQENTCYANILSQMDYPDFPVPLGIFRQIKREIYSECIGKKHKQAIAEKDQADLEKLLHQGHVWKVE